MNDLQRLLRHAKNGSAVLICGAGLTADCLNFDEEQTLGVSYELLQIINNDLKQCGKSNGYKDIKNASRYYIKEIGADKLMALLKNRFELSNISASIEDIVKYPWKTIYTTNYDDGLEMALHRAVKKYVAINNSSNPEDSIAGTPVIHLHGRAKDWNSENFLKSCVLDTNSYRELAYVKQWLPQLRSEIERAELVVFLGFSANDLHLNDIFYNSTGLKSKAFFINRPASTDNLDERATQEEFGQPLYIGREAFAELVTSAVSQAMPTEPKLSSFKRYVPPLPSETVPPTKDIEDLLIWGRVVESHVKRDIEVNRSDYHVFRRETNKVIEAIQSDRNVVLLQGEICDGKSLIIRGALSGLVGGRPVFELFHPYSDFIDEFSELLRVYPNAIFVVENGFSLRETHLLALARQVSASAGGLIISARSISREAETGKHKSLQNVRGLQEIKIGELDDLEVDSLIALIDQLAGWKEFYVLSHSKRRRFVKQKCKSSIPSVLLEVLNSSYVKDKYKEEYNKLGFLDKSEMYIIIASLVLSNIGIIVRVSYLSDIFEKDVGIIFRGIENQSGGLKLVRQENDKILTVPSIGSRNLLKNVINDRDCVNTVIMILEKLAYQSLRNDFDQHILVQLMRYSILSSIVSDQDEVNRFFDHISKLGHLREMPLFWLQWHMAMCSQRDWIKAETYLDQGYKVAEAFEQRNERPYNKKQLNDRKAKFLAARAIDKLVSETELFRDMREALNVVQRLIRDSELTHHPYETLLDISRAIADRGETIPSDLKNILKKMFLEVIDTALKRLEMVPQGYQRSRAVASLDRIDVTQLPW